MLKFIAVILFFYTSAFAAPVYVYKESDGTIRFTSKKPPKAMQAKVFNGYENKVSYYAYRGSYNWNSPKSKTQLKKYHDFIESASRRHGINQGLVKAVIHAESAFNPRAVSPKGARGLMQLMPENLRKYGVKDAFSPIQNIEGGVRLLSSLVRKYHGNLKLTLAAYNAGEGAVEKYNGIPPYRETQEYVRRVLNLYNRYQTLA